MSDTQQKLREALSHDLNAQVESLLIAGNKITCVLKEHTAPDVRAMIEETLKKAAPFKQVVVLSTQSRPEPANPQPIPQPNPKPQPESSPQPANGINPSGIDRIKHIVAIASGKGGVGKSTVATNLAVTLARSGLKVGLLDADIYGPSIPMMLGVDQRPESPDGKVMIPVQAHGLSTLSIGYMLADKDPVVWRGPMVHSALQQMLGQALWGELDVLLIDMPPGTGDVALTLAQRGRLSGAVIVTTPQNVALADARKGIGMFRKVDVPILGIIENMAFHECPKCATKSHIFGTGGGVIEAKEQSVDFLGALPLQSEVCQQGDMGAPIVLQSESFQGYFEVIATNLRAKIKL